MALYDTNKHLNLMIECAVCAGTYCDPRMLPCVHTFCKKCVEGFGLNKPPGEMAACPLCKKEFQIPERGISGLPKNFFLKQLSEQSEPLSPYCEGCYSDGVERKLATMFCVECSQKFCDTCVDSHKRIRTTRNHNIVNVGDGDHASSSSGVLASICCDDHDGEIVKVFCFDCRTAICTICFEKKHTFHRCSDVIVVAENCRRQVADDSQNLASKIADCRLVLLEQDKKKSELISKLGMLEREICDRAEQLKQLIDMDKYKLLREVESSKTDAINQIDSFVTGVGKNITFAEDLIGYITFAEDLIGYIEELKNKGAVSEIARQMDIVHGRAGELTALNLTSGTVHNVSSVDFTFKAANWPMRLNENVIGTVSFGRVGGTSHNEFSTNLQTYPVGVQLPCGTKLNETDTGPPPYPVGGLSSCYKPPFVSLNPTLTYVIPPPVANRSVVGLTFLFDQLFVLREPNEKQIEVYSTSTFTLQRTIIVNHLGNPITGNNGLASCATFNCLYVSDYRKNLVHKIELFDGNQLFWKVCSGPQGLSVNKECNVLVSCNGWTSNDVAEYTSSGSLVRQVTLSYGMSGFVGPLHAIQLSNYNQFIVSHDIPFNGISVVDWEGNLISSYRNAKDIKLLKHPRVLVVDKNDFVLAADQGNNRVLILSPSMTGARDLPLLVEGRGLEGPFCLHFDESRGRLYVGEFDGNRVLVFDNVFNIGAF